MSHEQICPNCGKTEHTGLSKQIELWILEQPKDQEITAFKIANEFHITFANASKYLNKFTDGKLLFKHYRGKKLYFHRIMES